MHCWKATRLWMSLKVWIYNYDIVQCTYNVINNTARAQRDEDAQQLLGNLICNTVAISMQLSCSPTPSPG